MKFYTVTNQYILYLKQFDLKVPDNYNAKRPYVGVILYINAHTYLAPLTSYKPKQDLLKASNPTIFKIHEKNNVLNPLGMIHLNNMIPVIESEIQPIDFALQPVEYRQLLSKQLEFIKTNQDVLKKKAKHLYDLVTVNKTPYFCRLSCDFLYLESVCSQFNPTSNTL